MQPQIKYLSWFRYLLRLKARRSLLPLQLLERQLGQPPLSQQWLQQSKPSFLDFLQWHQPHCQRHHRLHQFANSKSKCNCQ